MLFIHRTLTTVLASAIQGKSITTSFLHCTSQCEGLTPVLLSTGWHACWKGEKLLCTLHAVSSDLPARMLVSCRIGNNNKQTKTMSEQTIPNQTPKQTKKSDSQTRLCQTYLELLFLTTFSVTFAFLIILKPVKAVLYLMSLVMKLVNMKLRT